MVTASATLICSMIRSERSGSIVIGSYWLKKMFHWKFCSVLYSTTLPSSRLRKSHIIPHQQDAQRRQPLVVLMRPEPGAPACSKRALGFRWSAHLSLPLQDRLQDLAQFLFEPGMQDRIGSREHAFGTHQASRRAKQGQQFRRASTRILMGQAAWVFLQVPVFSRLGNSLIRSGFILAPEFDSSSLRDAVGQFNQALFLLRLRIVDGHDARFAHAHRRAGPTPGAAASEDVACFVQDAADGTRSDTRQEMSAQGPLQQPERPGGALILLPIGGTAQVLQDVLSL